MALLPTELRIAVAQAEGLTGLVRAGSAGARNAATALGIAHTRIDEGTRAIATVLSADDLNDPVKLLAGLRAASSYLGNIEANANAVIRGFARLSEVFASPEFASLATLKAGVDAVINELAPPPPPVEEGEPI